MKKIILAGLLSYGLLTGTAAAQQSPHGKLDVPCLDCHTTSSWEMAADAKFTHESTGFPLEGQHRFLECRSCHRDLVFAAEGQSCLSCHTDIHNSELGTECMSCHTTTTWAVPDMRRKHQQTRFPLVGRHLDAECESCHENATARRFASTSTECISCHRADFTATMEPSHVEAGFPVDCANCHRVTASVWNGSFDHSLTAFPLTGAHRALICSECHENNSFRRLPTDCFSCHDGDFSVTVSPAHATLNFSHECLACHTTAAWQPATFDHNQTAFALTGKHTATPCADCHKDGNYQLAFTDCYACHQPDYAGVVDPDHVTPNFGHDCTPCHTTTAWSPSTFNHDAAYFRIYSGRHRGRWATCATCHQNPANYASFTCISCHEHSEAETAGHHGNVGDYIYTATSCYSCHDDA